MTQQKLFQAVFLIALLGSVLLLFVHFRNPMIEYHSPREIDTYAIAKNFYEMNLPIWKPYIHFYDIYVSWEFQLYTYLVAKLFALFNQESVAIARFVSILAATLSIPIFWGIVHRLYRNKEAAFLATILFAYAPLRIYFGRTVQPDSLMMFFGILSIWAMLQFKDTTQKPFAALSFISSMLAGLLKPYALLFLVAVGWIYADNFVWLKQKHCPKRFLKWLLAIGITSTPVIAYYYFAAGGQLNQHLGVISALKSQIEFPHRDNIIYILRGLRPLFFELHPILIILFIASLFRLRSYASHDVFLLPTLVASGIFAFATMGVWLAGAHEHHILPLVPFMAIHAAKVFAESHRLKKRLAQPFGLTVFIVILISFSLFGNWILFRRTVKYAPIYLHQGNIIAQHTKPNDLIITNDSQGNHYLFFAKRGGFWIPTPRDPVAWDQETIASLIKSGAKYLVITDYTALNQLQKDILMGYQLLYQEITPFNENFRIYQL